jgi:hypothetical protein
MAASAVIAVFSLSGRHQGHPDRGEAAYARTVKRLLVIAWVSSPARCQEPCVPFYPAPDRDVHLVAAGEAACRCCPGGISRSTRARRYPSDMTGAEWAVCEPLLPARHGWPGTAAARPAGAYATSSTRSATSPITVRSGGRCLRISRPPGRCTGGQISGRRTGRRSGCTRTCATGSGPPGGRQRRRRRSSIPSRSKARR